MCRKLDTERRDNQIGGTVPLPESGRSSPPSLNYTEQTHHISPPSHPGEINSQRVLTAKTQQNTNNREKGQTSAFHQRSGRRYRAVLRQASWSQYEASILLYPSVFENQRVLVLLYDPALLYGNVMVNPLGTGTSRLPVVHHVFLWLWLACVSHLSAWFIRMSYSCP